MPPHVLTAYAVYELPFGRGKAYRHDMNKVVNAVIGGWQVCPDRHLAHRLAAARLRSVRIIPERSVAVRAPIATRPPGDYRRDTNQSTPGVGGFQWFTKDGNFTNPAPGNFGTRAAAALGGLRGPHYTDVDLGSAEELSSSRSGSNCSSAPTSSTRSTTCRLNAPNMGLWSAGWEQITSAQPPRNIQLRAEALTDVAAHNAQRGRRTPPPASFFLCSRVLRGRTRLQCSRKKLTAEVSASNAPGFHASAVFLEPV